MEDEESFLDLLLEVLQIVANLTSGVVLLLSLAVYFRGVRHEARFIRELHHGFETAWAQRLRTRGKKGKAKR